MGCAFWIQQLLYLMPVPSILSSNITDASSKFGSGNATPDVSFVLATKTAPSISRLPLLSVLLILPCPITRITPRQPLSGSMVKFPVTRRRPYPVLPQWLKSRSPFETTVSMLDGDMFREFIKEVWVAAEPAGTTASAD